MTSVDKDVGNEYLWTAGRTAQWCHRWIKCYGAQKVENRTVYVLLGTHPSTYFLGLKAFQGLTGCF